MGGQDGQQMRRTRLVRGQDEQNFLTADKSYPSYGLSILTADKPSPSHLLSVLTADKSCSSSYCPLFIRMNKGHIPG
uniref:Uncharacterized protein n=1 Tax=Acrobeloides nanus TaxID=290746 RepID=A0A914D1L8_9BILA